MSQLIVLPAIVCTCVCVEGCEVLYMCMYCVYDIYAENGQAMLCGGKGEKKWKAKGSRPATCCVCRHLCSALVEKDFVLNPSWLL